MTRWLAVLACSAFGAACASASPGELPAHFSRLPKTELVVATAQGTHRFDVWIAADDASREHGLMRVRSLPPDAGMLFLFDRPQIVAFWMKDTWLALDMVFVAADGTVVNVAERTIPHSLEPVESDAPVVAVLEIAAGTAERVGLRPGDRVRLPTLRTTGSRTTTSRDRHAFISIQ